MPAKVRRHSRRRPRVRRRETIDESEPGGLTTKEIEELVQLTLVIEEAEVFGVSDLVRQSFLFRKATEGERDYVRDEVDDQRSKYRKMLKRGREDDE